MRGNLFSRKAGFADPTEAREVREIGTSVGKSPPIVVIVDANPSDYVSLAPLVEAGEIDIRFLLSGRSAMREGRYLAAPLWMININLPDHNGFDVLEMYFQRKTTPLILMVADEYAPEDELRALELGVAKYLCKPVDPAWLHAYLHQIKVKAGGARATAATASRRLPTRAPPNTTSDTAANRTSTLR